MKKKKSILIILIVIIVGILSYSYLLSKFKREINNIVDNLPSEYRDYYNESIVNDIDEFNENKNSNNIIFVYKKYKNIKTNINNESFYKTNGITPSIYIYTQNNDGRSLTKEMGYEECEIVYINENGNGIVDYESKVKVRGNSTAGLDKRPYTIKFSSKQNLIDAGKAKKWNLLAEAYDPTLLRNNTFLTLAEVMELKYTPKHHYVELYMDSSYMGCYLLTESVEVDEERVDLDLDNNDFFLEFEDWRVEKGVYYFEPGKGIRLALKEPEEPSDNQLKYYEDTINQLVKVLYGNDYEELCKYYDVDSFVRFYLLNEFAKTADFPESSVNFYYKDGKLYAGPVWDFDLSSGNAGIGANAKYWDTYNGEKLSYINHYCRELNPIFKQLFEYDEIKKMYNIYFDKYKDDLKNVFESGGFIDKTIDSYGSIFNRNFASREEGGAWWKITRLYDTVQYPPFSTYQENVDYLKNFLKNRYEWLENNK